MPTAFTAISCSAGTSKSAFGFPSMSSARSTAAVYSLDSWRSLQAKSEPLSTIARRNRPFAAGIAMSVAIEKPLPEHPNTVTLPGSPPNAAMLSRTHSSAEIWSSNPALPAVYSPPSTSPR
jgi:hypothetical protein